MSTYVFCSEALLALALCGALPGWAARADESASVNGKVVLSAPDNAVNQVTTVAQDGVIAPLYPAAAAVVTAQAAVTAFHATANGVVLDNAFPEVSKGPGTNLLAETKLLDNPAAQEKAKGKALQNVVQFAPPKFQVYLSETSFSPARAAGVPNPMATAFAINSDPVALGWGSTPALTFDPRARSLASSAGQSAAVPWRIGEARRAISTAPMICPSRRRPPRRSTT